MAFQKLWKLLKFLYLFLYSSSLRILRLSRCLARITWQNLEWVWSLDDSRLHLCVFLLCTKHHKRNGPFLHTEKLRKKISEDIARLNSTVQALRAFILGLRRLWSIFSHIFTSPSRTADAGIRDILARFKELWPTQCFSKIEVGAVFTSSSNKKKLPTSLRSGRRASVAFKIAFLLVLFVWGIEFSLYRLVVC